MKIKKFFDKERIRILLQTKKPKKRLKCYEIWRPNIPVNGCSIQCKECREKEEEENKSEERERRINKI